MKKPTSILFFFLFCLSLNAKTILVLEENFENNDAKWYEQNTKEVTSSVTDGHYYINNKTGQSRWIYKDIDNINPNESDFIVEVKLRQLSGSTGMGYGLLFSLFRDNKTYQKFLLNSSSQFKIDNYKNKRSHLLANYTTNKEINRGYRYNILKVVKRANTVSYFVNDVLVCKNSENSLFSNRIAFFVGGKMSMEIDYIKVTKSPSAIDVVQNADKIGAKEKLDTTINSPYSELAPIISADGKTMFVCRSNHPDNIKGNDIWYSNLDENGNWETLKIANQPINNEGHNFVVSVAPDNNSIVLANTYQKDGSMGGNGLSISHKTNKGWSIPQTMEIDNFYNKDKFVSYFLCPDNKTLLLSVKRNDSFGAKDLYVSFLKEDNTWSKPLNMGNMLNTFENEVNPFIAADNQTLYFASQGHAGYGHHDIFVSKRLDDSWTNWSKPQNLGPKLNTPKNDFSFFLDAKGEYAYIGSAGDIWKVENPLKPEPTLLIKGTVLNAKTKTPMAVDIVYHDLVTGEELGIASSNAVTGAYQIVLPVGRKYGYQAEEKGFYAISNSFDVEQLEDYEEKTVDLYLKPIEKGEVVRLNNIFFEFDKAILKKESFVELNRLVAFLEEHPSLEIEIAGHTDDKGSSSYNQELSQDRANAVVKYLIGKGILSLRLKGVGYGEEKPIYKNYNDENRAKNRRVEFKVL